MLALLPRMLGLLRGDKPSLLLKAQKVAMPQDQVMFL